MRFWTITLILILLALVFGIGYALGGQRIRVVVGAKALPPAAWTMQHGQVSGPVAPVARALGADVSLNARTGTLWITPSSPWVQVNREPNWGYNAPFDFTALGPILTVRHALAEEQWASLTRPGDAGEPILARCEIVDANSVDMMVPPGTDGRQGFTVQAYLYWAYKDPKQEVPRGGARILAYTHKGGGEGYQQEGQRLRKMRLDIVTYEVAPNEVTTVTPADNPLPGAASVRAIEQGKTGWTITRRSVNSSESFEASKFNTRLPVYEISIRQIHPTPR